MTITPDSWRCLVVDDDEDFCRQVDEYLRAEGLGDESVLEVTTLTDFDEALPELASGRFDVVILDVRRGAYEQHPEEEAGAVLMDAIRARCFVPIVFYTGLPKLAPEPQGPFVTVVEKSQGVEQLKLALQEVFATQLPAMSRALYRHLEDTQREYMWDFVVRNWDQICTAEDRTAVAYMLARRLSVSLSGSGIRRFVAALGGDPAEAGDEDRVHPMRYYLMPPVDQALQACDVFRGEVDGQDGYWVLLTPSCDMVPEHEKAEWVILACCLSLKEQAEYTAWRDSLPNPSQTKRKRLEALLRNNRQAGQQERYYFLPGALGVPELLVDLQRLTSIRRQQLSSLERLASLDAPFSAALLGRFARYVGRHGSADLNVEMVMNRLQEYAHRQQPTEQSD